MYWLPDDGIIRISATDGRAKTANLRRDARASLHVTSDDFWSYVVIEAQAEVTAVAASPDDAVVDELVEYYRALSGEHPDWDDYRRTMVADRRLVLRLRPERAYGMTSRADHPSAAKTGSHEVDEVVVVEGAAIGLVDAGERALEALDRPPPALDVREVRREQADLRTGLLDDPARRPLVGEGVQRICRRTHLLGRRDSACYRSSCRAKASNADSIWRIHDGNQIAPCSMTPTAEVREALEHACRWDQVVASLIFFFFFFFFFFFKKKKRGGGGGGKKIFLSARPAGRTPRRGPRSCSSGSPVWRSSLPPEYVSVGSRSRICGSA